MASSDRIKNLAVHFEKVAYGGAAVLALVVFLIPFLSSSDLKDSFNKVDTAKTQFIEKAEKIPPIPPAPPIKPILEKQWVVEPAPEPWVSPWTTEVRPQAEKVKAIEITKNLVHEAGKVAKITPVRDAKKFKVVLKVEGARGKKENSVFKSAKLQRKVIEPPPEAGTDFTDVKDFGADQEIKYDDADVKCGATYQYRLITEVVANKEVEVKDPQELTRTSNELPLLKVIPWDYRIRIISCTGYDAKTGTDPSLNGEVYFWDYASSKVVQVPNTAWKEKASFGPKVNGQDRYKIQQIEDGKVHVKDQATGKTEILTTKENKRDVDLPQAVTPELAASAAAAATEALAPKPPKTDAKAAGKKTAGDDGDDEKPKKPAAGKDAGKPKPDPKKTADPKKKKVIK